MVPFNAIDPKRMRGDSRALRAFALLGTQTFKETRVPMIAGYRGNLRRYRLASASSEVVRRHTPVTVSNKAGAYVSPWPFSDKVCCTN